MDTDDTFDTLNGLIETAKDGEYSFRTSAEYLRSEATRRLFACRTEDCRMAAQELQSLIDGMGAKAARGGSANGSMHRGWVAVKGTLAGYSDKAILEETERGEDSTLSRYRQALEGALPIEVRRVIERQLEGVKRNHAQVRSFRHQARRAGT